MDWKSAHKYQECQLFKTMDEEQRTKSSQKMRISWRMILLITQNPASRTRKFKLNDGNERGFFEMMGHEDHVKKSSRNIIQFNLIMKSLKLAGIIIDENDAFRIYCRIVINAHEIIGDKVFGAGFYIQYAYFDHSCHPNTIASFDGKKIILKAARDIINQPVYVTYTDLVADRASRQEVLLNVYNFHCHCSKCDSDFDSTINYKRVTDLQIIHNSFEPKSCRGIKSYEEIYKVMLELLTYYELIFGTYNPSISLLLCHIFITRNKLKIEYSTQYLDELANDLGANYSDDKVEKNILITHGAEHKYFLSFKQMRIDQIKRELTIKNGKSKKLAIKKSKKSN